MRTNLILFKNAAANVARGSSAALVAILLPPFLTRLMSVEAYGAWALVLQLSAYVGYLDFGIQTAVGRFVAHAGETGDSEQKDRIVSSSLAGLSVAGLIGLFGSVTLAVLMPRIFPKLPIQLLPEARLALVLVASSLAIGLPASVFNGIFVGLQRYEIPAMIIGGSRIVSALLLIFVVRHGGTLAEMGLSMGVINIISYIGQYAAYRKLAIFIRIDWSLISLKGMRELFDYCFSLSLWSFGMLLISGLDVLLVGYFQFTAVAYYAVAATFITFSAGLQNAVFGVMVPATAIEHARGNSVELGRGLITATRYGSFLLLFTGVPLFFFARSLLAAWVGAAYALQGTRILQVLVIANVIRLSAAPYVMTLIGTGQQRLVTLTPLIEGFSNLIASLIGGYLLGAVGVALGTLIGSVAGIGGNLFYNMRRTHGIQFRVSDYLREGVLRPALCVVPMIASLIFIYSLPNFPVGLKYLFIASGVSATVLLIWCWGLAASERAKLRLWRIVLQS